MSKSLNTKGVELDDIVKFYLDEVAKYPLLTHEEELELGKIVRDYLLTYEPKKVQNKKAPTRVRLLMDTTAPPEEKARFEMARKRMIVSNLRLVASIAFRYSRILSMEMSDILQEGNLGLMRAVEKFDYRKGFKFSTYASWWIRQGIIRSAYNNRQIKVPIYRIEQQGIVKNTTEHLLQKMGREPTIQEISDACGISVKDLQQILTLPEKLSSINTPVADAEGLTYEELLEDKDALDPEEETVEKCIRESLHDFLQKRIKDGRMTERDYNIIQMRYGLGEYTETNSLEQIGQAFGLTRERIRQIIIRHLKRMRLSASTHFDEKPL